MRAAWDLTRREEFDLVLSDISLVGESGIDLVRRLRESGFEGSIVVMTAYGTVDTAVEAMRAGADDFVQKPIGLQELGLVVKKHLEHLRVRSQLKLYQRLDKVCTDMSAVLGESMEWKRVLGLAARFAAIPLPQAGQGIELPTILLLGETGCGKGVLARFIHNSSTAATGVQSGPFIHVNCAALPPNLIEAELFGHEKGAFTDAKEARAGLFEMAEGGTIFLDEIGDMPVEMQSKLLLVVEHGMLRRIGGTKERPVRARIIAATNQNLDRSVETGAFRRDLLYRLNALVIRIPSLRDRRGDAVIIAEHLLRTRAEQVGRPGLKFSAVARQLIENHTWHGNVRELSNVVRRAVMLCERDVIEAADLAIADRAMPAIQANGVTSPRPTPLDVSSAVNAGVLPTLDEMERSLISEALRRCRGNVSQAARMLGLNRGALRYRLEQHGMNSAGIVLSPPLEREAADA